MYSTCNNATYLQQKKTRCGNKPTKHKQKIIDRQFFEMEYLPFEKKTTPVRFKLRTFAAPDVFFASRLRAQEMQKKVIYYELDLNLLFLILTTLRTKLFTGKSPVPDCNTLAYCTIT